MELSRKKNVATTIYFPLMQVADGTRAFTGTAWAALTGEVLSACYDDGAGETVLALDGTPTECTNVIGGWKLAISQTHMNHDRIMIKLTASEIADQFILINTVQNVDTYMWNGTAVAAPATAGYPAVTVKVGTGTGEINLSSGKAPATIATGDDVDGTILLRATVMNSTTIATLASQTQFTLTAGSTDNNAYVGCIAVVKDAATAVQKCMGYIKTYTGATKTVVLLGDPGTFAMEAGDTIDILSSVGRGLGIPVMVDSGTQTVVGMLQKMLDDNDGGAFDATTDSLAKIVTTGVNVKAINTNTTAASNCGLFFDGTGYAGGTTKLNVNTYSMSTDALSAAAVSAGAVTKIQTGITPASFLAATADGIAVSTIYTALYAYLYGVGTVSTTNANQTVTYYKQDGTTKAIKHLITSTDRTPQSLA